MLYSKYSFVINVFQQSTRIYVVNWFFFYILNSFDQHGFGLALRTIIAFASFEYDSIQYNMKCLDQAQILLKYKPAGTRVEIQTDDNTSKREREMFGKNNNSSCCTKLAVKFPVSLTIDERACDPSSEIIGLSAQVQVVRDDLSSSFVF